MAEVNITPTEDGPYMVSGQVVLTAPDGGRAQLAARGVQLSTLAA